MTERGETIGVLELVLPEKPDAETTDDIARIGHLLAFIIIANRRHTDLFEWGQRSRSFSLSAEIQQRLLPPARTCEASAFTLSGWLEPAATIGGDTFDYILDRDVLHLSLTDAMGHGVGAALTATVCTASLRNSRRQGATLRDQADETNLAVVEHAASRVTDEFLTGLVGRLDLATGSLALVNAGHVAPYLARGSEVTKLTLPPDLPLGMFRDTTYGSSVRGDRRVASPASAGSSSVARRQRCGCCRRRARGRRHGAVPGLARRPRDRPPPRDRSGPRAGERTALTRERIITARSR